VAAAAAGGDGRFALEQAGAAAASAAAAAGRAAERDHKLQTKPLTEQQQLAARLAAISAGVAAAGVKPDEPGLAAGACSEADAAPSAPSAAPASVAAEDPHHSSASPEQQQQSQQTAQQQKQSLLLHMLSGLLTATLGLPAAPSSMPAGSEVQQQVQQVLADPATQQLLDACLADQAGTAWLGEFLSKLGFEQGLLQQRLQSRAATVSPAAAGAGAAAAAEPSGVGGCSEAARQQLHTAVEAELGQRHGQCSTEGQQARGSSSRADGADVPHDTQQRCADHLNLQQQQQQ
jgi:hypothetical protein